MKGADQHKLVLVIFIWEFDVLADKNWKIAFGF
jgi:hypothetical protein